MNLTRTRTLALAAPLCLAGALGVGCAGTTPQVGDTGPTCSRSSEPPDGAIAFLVDGSTSATDTAHVETSTTWVLQQANRRGAALSVATFGGSDAEIDLAPCIHGAAFVAPGKNDRLRTANTPAFLAGAEAEVSLLRRDFVSSDPAAAYRGGVSMLSTADDDQPRLIVIETDGVATAGCAALPSSVDPTDRTLIAQLVAACAPVLPDASGIDVVILGIGRTGELSSESVQFLTDLNLALCAATHAASCTAPATRPDVL